MTPQVQTILKHLQTQGSITQAEAGLIYKIRALPRRISDLKELGHKIISTMKTDATGQRYARYSLMETPKVGYRVKVTAPYYGESYKKGDEGVITIASVFKGDFIVKFDSGLEEYVDAKEGLEVITNV